MLSEMIQKYIRLAVEFAEKNPDIHKGISHPDRNNFWLGLVSYPCVKHNTFERRADFYKIIDPTLSFERYIHNGKMICTEKMWETYRNDLEVQLMKEMNEFPILRDNGYKICFVAHMAYLLTFSAPVNMREKLRQFCHDIVEDIPFHYNTKNTPEDWKDFTVWIIGAMYSALQPDGDHDMKDKTWTGGLFPIYNDADMIYDQCYNLWAWLAPFLPDDPYRFDNLFDISCMVLPQWDERKLFDHLGGAILPVINELKTEYPYFQEICQRYHIEFGVLRGKIFGIELQMQR